MIAALFAALFSGITPVVASRGIKLIGFVRANVLRLSFAVAILGVWPSPSSGLRGQTLLFVTAGAIGFGIGGLSLLAALPRLGAPLASLWRRPSPPRGGSRGVVLVLGQADDQSDRLLWVILVGVVIGLLPYVRATIEKGVAVTGVALGIGLALLAAAAQASASPRPPRHAAHGSCEDAARRHHRCLPAADRCFLVALVVYAAARWVWRKKWGFARADGSTASVLTSDGGKLTTRPLFWGSLNSLFGPILAVTGTVWPSRP